MMSRSHSRPRRTPLLSVFALGACSLILMAGSTPQCSRQSDVVFEPNSTQLLAGEGGDCPQACAEAAADARQLEKDRFVGALRACTSGECRQEEAALHMQVMQEIAADQNLCQSACHNQGGGSGGN